MSFTHERKKIEIIPYPLEGRETIIQRLEVCKDNIHSPFSWYREDVRRLLIMLDFQHTELMQLKNEQEED